jgi:hypothetical protein
MVFILLLSLENGLEFSEFPCLLRKGVPICEDKSRILAKAGKKITTKVEIRARTYQTNIQLEASFTADDAGLETPAAKILDDIDRWQLPEFEGTINLKAEKIPINEIRELLKNTLKTDDPKLKLALEIKPEREK